MIFHLNKEEYKKIENIFKIRDYNEQVAISLNKDLYTNSKRRLKGVDYEIVDPSIYNEDSFNKSIKINESKYKNYFLGHEKYYKDHLYLKDDIKITADYIEIPQVMVLTSDYSFIKLDENDTTWMSIIPHEINTMKSAIKKLTGDVVILGLGLGYFAYHVSKNPNVKSITIIENNKDIIEIFNKNIKGFFKESSDIKIFYEDAIKYVKKLKNANIFADLWHDSTDGLELYCALRKIEVKNKQNTTYWIEDTLIAGFRRLLINLVEEELDEDNEYGYEYEENFDDHIINRLHELLKEKTINSYLELMALLSKDSIRDLASKI